VGVFGGRVGGGDGGGDDGEDRDGVVLVGAWWLPQFFSSSMLEVQIFLSVYREMSPKAHSSMWAIVDEALASAAILPYAQAAPNIAKTADDFENQQRTITRNKLVKLIDGALRHPELITVMEGTLEHHLKRKEDAKDKVPDGIEADAVKGLSENWIVAFICSRSNLTVEDLKAAKAYDPDAPRQLFCYELGCETSMRLGKECHDQAVLRAACLAASEANGNPLENWTRGVEMTKDGDLLWPRYGVYSVAFGDDNMSVSVTHLPSGDREPFPEEERFSAKATVADNWSATSAKIYANAGSKAGIPL
jgi:hypothetical protein